MDELRVEHVGSLVRPAWLESATLRNLAGRMSAAQLRSLQDQAVDQAIAKQAALGLGLVTDGELRRVPLLSARPATSKPRQRGWSRRLTHQTHDEALSLVSGAVATEQRTEANAALGEYRHARQVTDLPVKVCLLGPERAAQGFDATATRPPGGFEERLAEVIRVERRMIAELLESSDELIRRIDEAAQFVDVDQLAIGPQCGFAGPVGGRDISEAAQWGKLDQLLDAAGPVWP